MAKQTAYLHTWVNFGKYRNDPKTVQSIIDSGESALNWVKWLMENSWNFKPAQDVTDYIAKKEVEYGCVLQA